MRKILVLFVMFVLCQNCGFGENSKTAEVTYIANEGFLIKVGEKKIIIDALFGHKEYGWCEVPNTEVMNSMLKNEGDFKDVDLVTVTHAHIDHIFPKYVKEHLVNNPHGKFISTRQSANALKRLEDYDKINKQVIEITPGELSFVDTTINGIDVRIYRIAHGPYYEDDPETGEKVNSNKNIQNLGFLFNIDGLKIFHSGDSNENVLAEYEHFKLEEEDIDIAIMNGGFMWKAGCSGIDLMKKYVNAKHIIMMHLHPDEHAEYKEIAKGLENDFQSIQIFENKMDTRVYTFE